MTKEEYEYNKFMTKLLNDVRELGEDYRNLLEINKKRVCTDFAFLLNTKGIPITPEVVYSLLNQ